MSLCLCVFVSVTLLLCIVSAQFLKCCHRNYKSVSLMLMSKITVFSLRAETPVSTLAKSAAVNHLFTGGTCNKIVHKLGMMRAQRAGYAAV